jgi:hypothetical protein
MVGFPAGRVRIATCAKLRIASFSRASLQGKMAVSGYGFETRFTEPQVSHSIAFSVSAAS